ncbi:TasA family protein [Bacillus carboniphilus]|uniref:TasA family protein n=1 Tax=Bacillus carboniphilus TaxID=86663 RepID=A0ABY9JWX6_9BACI|nr:TasA family protein [Bacillus carboniphilus]WLR43912.1 TasA family protein [Bacillus carboniphilus]
MANKKYIILFISFMSAIFFYIPSAQGMEQLPPIKLTTDLSSSGEVFINVDNVKPGDWMPRSISVTNQGSADFRYTATAKRSKGSKKFYEQLDLKVVHENLVLYEGKLSDFTGLEPRMIKMNQTEELFFTITVPYELGNEFQGLISEIELQFFSPDPLGYGGGDGGGLIGDPSKSGWLPQTATQSFNILAVGFMLLIFGIFLQIAKRNEKRVFFLGSFVLYKEQSELVKALRSLWS